MRLSTKRDDPGYHPLAGIVNVRVTLDGAELPYVVTADEERGEAVVLVRDALGVIQLNRRRTDVLLETRRGQVRIVHTEQSLRVLGIPAD